MTLQPQHFGLFFDEDLIQAAQQQRDTEPIRQALDFATNSPVEHPLAEAQLAGLRYQFLADSDSGLAAMNALPAIELTPTSYRDALQQTLTLLSIAESVRGHPEWHDAQNQWLRDVRQQVADLNDPPDDATLLDGFWLGALNIGAAIVYEDETLLKQGTAIYQLAIDDHIHPEGYLKGLVDDDDASDTYQIQMLGTAALVLMAEMADLAGVDLWSITNRGITPITAATYLMYYYYYPDKWKWEDGLTSEVTQAEMASSGAFIEMVNRRSPIRGIDIMLDELRPLYSLYCGGLTTLTHGTTAPPKKNRWRLFGS